MTVTNEKSKGAESVVAATDGGAQGQEGRDDNALETQKSGDSATSRTKQACLDKYANLLSFFNRPQPGSERPKQHSPEDSDLNDVLSKLQDDKY